MIILGAGRSGTKFLRQLLAASRACRVIPSGINPVWRYGNHGYPNDALPAARCTDRIARHIREDLLRLAAVVPEDAAACLVEKSSANTLRVPFVAAVLPDACYLHLIRDGRDVALSQLEVHHGAESVADAAQDWVGGIEKARRNARKVGEYIEVRFEDLVSEPEPTLRRVCEFVALPFDASMLSYHERADERMSEIARDFDRQGQGAIPAEVRARQHARVGTPPQTQRAGRWRTEMTADDREAFESVAAELLADLGYEINVRGSA